MRPRQVWRTVVANVVDVIGSRASTLYLPDHPSCDVNIFSRHINDDTGMSSWRASLPGAFLRKKRFALVAIVVSGFTLLWVSQIRAGPTTWYQVMDLVSSKSESPSDVANKTSKPLASKPLRHQLIEGGRLKVTMGGPHPLHALIGDAEAKWNKMLEGQSTTLDEAVEEYQRRYARQPPVGFDKWYDFARKVGFKFIDEFDQIDRDITPLLALPHHVLMRRIAALSTEEHAYNLDIKDGKVSVGGKLADWEVALNFQDLISGFAKDLPNMKFYVYGHDMGATILAEDMRLAVNAALERGRRLTESRITKLESLERNPRRGVTNACLQDPITFYASALPERNRHTHTFIRDHRLSMSFCAKPAILNNPLKRHGYFAFDVPRPRAASPLFVQSQLSAGGSILHPALQDYATPEEYLQDFGKPMAWAKRTEKVFWRGRSTGEAFNREHDWRYSHRVRLHILANRDGNSTDPNVSPEVELLVEDGETGTVYMETYPRELLNERYMDVKMIGPPIQCDQSETDHTCEQMQKALDWGTMVGWEAGLDHKYLLDVDGNAWSSRFQRLLSSGAVVFKMTIFPEWNSDWLVPYYHYIPIQTDYSDLYDTFAFFMGVPGSNRTAPAHDDVAQKIAAHAREFSVRYWRWEDMQVYVYRLLLEYARLLAYDRDSMDME
ncbi:glycosyltransferase family 90 protein [Ceratobasidium sp. AG-Ba]|nr:glycosyltransferase family 90 protein [Ceratobasidium sp. AG-Ba]